MAASSGSSLALGVRVLHLVREDVEIHRDLRGQVGLVLNLGRNLFRSGLNLA